MMVMDSCSVILLAKATLLETAAVAYKVAITAQVEEEVLEGKKDKLADALLVERLVKESKLRIIDIDKKLSQKIADDFNMGKGEASAIAAAIKDKCIAATDNRQGRKAAVVNNIPLVGSPEIAVSLCRERRITKEKATAALNVLKEEGWFDQHIIEKAMEDVK